MRRRLGSSLWVGNAGDLRDPRRVLSAGVAAVVELADNEPLASLPRELLRLRFPLSDGGMNPEWLLRLAVESVAALLKSKVDTLICCSAGLSRSLCVAAAAAALADGKSFDEALLEAAKSGPADVSPGLAQQFRTLRLDPAFPSSPRLGGEDDVLVKLRPDLQSSVIQSSLSRHARSIRGSGN